MNIEIIDNQKFNEIWVEGKKWKEVHKKLYKNHLREILRASSKKDLRDIFLRLDTQLGRVVVYKLLALKGYMKSELVEKLKLRRIDPQAIEVILGECERLGYIDDQREGKLFIQRQKRKGWGPQVIAQKLSMKAPELVELVKISDEEELNMIEHWIQKKTRSQDLHDLKVKQKLYRFLKGKGFNESLVRQSLFAH